MYLYLPRMCMSVQQHVIICTIHGTAVIRLCSYLPNLSLTRTGSKLGITPLMLAAMNGHTAAVKLLLDNGSDINAQVHCSVIA